MSITAEKWNCDPWLLGTSSGVLDLRTGEMRPGEREDLVSLSLGVDYEPEAECPRWQRFVSEIFGGDQNLGEYIQRVLGYTLTGLTSEQTWFLCYGEGANGKSTLLNVLSHVLGDYAKTVPFSMFEQSQRSGIPDDVATLIDRRYVTANESIESARLNEARIKMLTGGDRVTARPLYGKWFEFDPHLKLFLSCNHKPTVVDDSHGFWRRVHVVPFTVRFDGQRREQGLAEMLKAEGSGILNWMLEGCELWQNGGLMPPGIVKAATSDYEQESNPLNEFLADRCELRAGLECSGQLLYNGYLSWARERSDHALINPTAFGRWMKKRVSKKRSSTNNIYVGIALAAA